MGEPPADARCLRDLRGAAFGLHEGFENAFVVLCRDPRAVVAHYGSDTAIGETLKGELDQCATGGKFDGVGQEIDQDLLDACTVADDFDTVDDGGYSAPRSASSCCEKRSPVR